MTRKILMGSIAVLTFVLAVSGGFAGGDSKPATAAGNVPQALAASGSATIKGKATLSGSPPTLAKIKMSADPICQQQHTAPVWSEEVVANSDGTLRNVFVYVASGIPPAAAPKEPLVLNQEGCLYTPHVFGIQVGQPLEIRNSDSTLHNINAQPKANKKFNIAQPVKGMKTVKTFDKPELAISFKCNVHPWMVAYGHVLDHPFFGVTNASGVFTIQNLPAGTYTIEAWHEKYGVKSQEVTVADGQTQEISFAF